MSGNAIPPGGGMAAHQQMNLHTGQQVQGAPLPGQVQGGGVTYFPVAFMQGQTSIGRLQAMQQMQHNQQMQLPTQAGPNNLPQMPQMP